MKCPNCGKEALFVNGKYVCVDCGIEITPEQQAFQNQANDQTTTPVTPDIEETVAQVAPVTPPVVEPEPIAPVAEQIPETPVTYNEPVAEKPVQQYYENALQEDAPQNATIPETKPGVYDFDNEPTTAPELPVAPAEVSIPSPSEPSVVVTPETSEPMTATTEAPSYFAPNTFEMSAASDSAVPAADAPNPEPMPTVEPQSDFPLTPAQTNIEEQAPAPITEIPPVTMPEELQSQPVPELKTLDEMLGGTGEIPVVPTENSPVSAYGTDVVPSEGSMPTPTNITNEKPMPSVESVFGSAAATDVPKSNLPTPQDFGVAPKPAPEKNKKILPFIIAGIAGLLLIVGITVAVLMFSGEEEVTYPVTLTDEQVNSLSSNVSTAMQQPQGITVDYTLEADFSKLIVKDTAEGADLVRAQLAENYKLTGSWNADPDGDYSAESTVGTLNDKRTYISENASTYVYTVATQSYAKQDGLLLAGVPAVFGAEEKAALLYTTNIKKASLLGPEQVDEVDCYKYQLTVDEENLKDSLAVIGGVFAKAEYSSLVTDNLKVYAWVTSDNKLKKISLSGEVAIETAELSGTITLTGEADYQYLTVSIEDPSVPAEATKNTETSVSTSATKNEEGETSSINNSPKIPEENQFIEARG